VQSALPPTAQCSVVVAAFVEDGRRETICSPLVVRGCRCSGKFVAPENYSHTQQYGLGLRLRMGLNLGLGLWLGLMLGLALALVTL